MDQNTERMEMECARDYCKVPIRVHIHVHIRVNSPLSYTWRVDFCTFKNYFVHLTFKTKKNGHKFLTFYIRPRSSVDLGQWG